MLWHERGSRRRNFFAFYCSQWWRSGFIFDVRWNRTHRSLGCLRAAHERFIWTCAVHGLNENHWLTSVWWHLSLILMLNSSCPNCLLYILPYTFMRCKPFGFIQRKVVRAGGHVTEDCLLLEVVHWLYNSTSNATVCIEELALTTPSS